MFSCEFVACVQNTFSYEHLWTAASDKDFVPCNRYNCRPKNMAYEYVITVVQQAKE